MIGLWVFECTRIAYHMISCASVGEPSIRILILYHPNQQTVEMNLALHSDVGNWQHYDVKLST